MRLLMMSCAFSAAASIVRRSRAWPWSMSNILSTVSENFSLEVSRALVFRAMFSNVVFAVRIADRVRFWTARINAKLELKLAISAPALTACASHRRFMSAAAECPASSSPRIPCRSRTTLCAPCPSTGSALSSIALTSMSMACVSAFFRKASSNLPSSPASEAPREAAAAWRKEIGIAERSAATAAACALLASTTYLPRNKSTRSCKVLCWASRLSLSV
mmetsp:Transcript_126645/g.366569  ORF Transcript_126645/g.366569 Transcript_126645/m.366569 type:complete len:219 (+) Transcript_126645:559-1215(+)